MALGIIVFGRTNKAKPRKTVRDCVQSRDVLKTSRSTHTACHLLSNNRSKNLWIGFPHFCANMPAIIGGTT